MVRSRQTTSIDLKYDVREKLDTIAPKRASYSDVVNALVDIIDKIQSSEYTRQQVLAYVKELERRKMLERKKQKKP